MTVRVGLPDSLLRSRPLTGKNRGGSGKCTEKLPSDTAMGTRALSNGTGAPEAGEGVRNRYNRGRSAN